MVAARALVAPFRWLRQLYHWTLRWASTPYGPWALAALAFAEASFFPIPPDVLLLALALGNPKRSFLFATICSAASLLGAVFGYALGQGLWSSFGVFQQCPQFGGGGWLFAHVPGFHCHVFEKVQRLYADNAWFALFTAAFTPIPFKVFTLAAGVFSVPLTTLITASAVGRSARFFLVALIVRWVGPPAKRLIEKHFEWITVTLGVLVVGGFIVLKWLF